MKRIAILHRRRGRLHCDLPTRRPVRCRDAGVNIDEGDRAVSSIKKFARQTFTKNVLTDIGSFGAMYQPPEPCNTLCDLRFSSKPSSPNAVRASANASLNAFLRVLRGSALKRIAILHGR